MKAEAPVADNWIPFDEGLYAVEAAFLVNAERLAVPLGEALIEVRTDRRGRRHLTGSGRLNTAQLVALLEDGDELDLLLDLGGPYQYRLCNPEIQGGKAFAPNVRATIQFTPRSPWQPMGIGDFYAEVATLRFSEK
jgi:hypothetical protein